MLGTVVLSLLLLSSGVEQDPRFTEALARFEAMDSAGSLSALQTLLKDPKLGDADRATVKLWIGVNQCELGDYDGAGASFERAIRLDPLVALPADASPRVLQEINRARARVRNNPESDRLGDEFLEEEPSEAVPPGPEPAPGEAAPSDAGATSFPWLLVSGAGVAGVGVVALGLGASFGLLAVNQHQGAVTATDAKAAASDLQDAETSALIANVLFIAGGVVLVAGGATAATSFFVGDDP